MAREDAGAKQRDAVPMRNQEQYAALVHTAYHALTSGDIAGLAPLLAIQAVAHEYDGTRYWATYQGRDTILARLDDLAPGYWDAMHVHVHSVAATDRLIAAIATWEGASRATGQSYAIRHVLVMRVAGHQCTEVWLIRADPIPSAAM